MVGSWVNSWLITLEILHGWRYFSDYPSDALEVRLAVATAMLIDAGATLATFVGVYEVIPSRGSVKS